MRVAVITGPGQVAIEDHDDPVLPGPGGAVVRVDRTAICGSDLHFYDDDIPMFPVAAGHEVLGTVVEAGADVASVAVGDPVLVASVAGCGSCDGCARRDPVQCVDGGKVFGAGELGGGQAELLAVPAADFNLLRVPDGVDDEAALLLTDNLATGWAGAKRGEVTPGDTVLVIGLGAVGLCAVRSAFALGAERVLVADPVEGRRARAASWGATVLEGPTVEAVLEATGGRGVPTVIDAVAKDATLDDAFGSVRAGGTVSVIGVHDLNPYPLQVLMGLFRSITLRMTTAPIHATWPDLVPLIQEGTLDTTGIFTHHFALEDAAAAYAAVAARTADCVKVTLAP
jgi:2-desacetyl-2-hydroxyethyl bacteriochlorophyllide A dehydrogenase